VLPGLFGAAHVDIVLMAPDGTMRSGDPPGPDFLCIGTLKAGTTSLFRKLRQHPKQWIPPVREINHFGRVPGGDVGAR
jgi:hypothetical protein